MCDLMQEDGLMTVNNKEKAEVWIIFCLACYGEQDVYWIGFVSDFGLYRRQTSQHGTILVPGLVAPNHLVLGHLVPF